MRFGEKSRGSVFKEFAELVDDLRGGERTDAEVGEPDVLAALREAHVQLSLVLLHVWIERYGVFCCVMLDKEKDLLYIYNQGKFRACDNDTIPL